MQEWKRVEQVTLIRVSPAAVEGQTHGVELSQGARVDPELSQGQTFFQVADGDGGAVLGLGHVLQDLKFILPLIRFHSILWSRVPTK